MFSKETEKNLVSVKKTCFLKRKGHRFYIFDGKSPIKNEKNKKLYML